MPYKTLNRLSAILLFISFPFLSFSQNTSVFIEGPSYLCAGECATYFAYSEDENFTVSWLLSDGAVYTDNPVTICFDQPGIYFLEIVVTFANGESTYLSYSIEVQYPEEIDIYSTASQVCPANDSIPNSPGSFQCEKVCSGSTVTYFVSGGISNLDGYWVVNGAESYEVDFDQVTVHWGNPGNGSVYYEAFNTGFCTQFGSICVDILDDPEASFTTSPPGSNGLLSICEGQTVYFENTSQNAESYLWNFGLNQTSSEVHPSFTYSNPGTYEVQLIALNECFCSDTTTLTVEVTDAESPLVDCVGTICEGEVVSYAAQSACGTYFWEVSGNGTIIGGGAPTDDYITVDWASGPEGTIELQVEDCSGLSTCLEPAQIQIPILSDTAPIEGPDKVCEGAVVNYSIIPYEGTDFSWSTSIFGTIIEGHGTNSIVVEWFDGFIPSDAQWVEVSYENCYLDCGGTAYLEVNIRPEFYVSGPIEVCENGNATYNSINLENNASMDCNWQVQQLNGTVLWTSAGATSNPAIDWNFSPGMYTLVAVPATLDAFCMESYEVAVQVVAAPPAVDAIIGSTEICPGLAYSYEADSQNPNNSFQWSITNGMDQSTVFGNPVNITWGASGPYELAVIQISTSGLACASSSIDINLSQIPAFTINGAVDVCQDQAAQYSVASYDQIDYEWNIIPADAGTIISEPNSNSIEVLWHLSGVAAINMTACGNADAFPVNVLPRPEPVVLHPTDLCPNETTMVQSTAMYTNYTWKDEFGTTVSNDPSPNIGPGYYQLVVEDQNGCIGDTTFHINGWPPSDISISTPDDTGFCPGDPGATLYALDTDAGYTYQWYQDGTAIPGATGQTHSSDQFGSYYVEITDINGCSFSSNTINLFEFCGFSGVCNGTTCTFVTDCDPGTNVQFDIQGTSQCNVRNYINTSPDFIPGSLVWDFDDPDSGADNTSTLENPSHTYTKAGFFTVILTGLSGDHANPGSTQLCWDAKVDTVLVAANFDVDNACPGEEVAFFDLSTYLPIASITAWEWNFGDPGSGTDNSSSDPNPTHIFANQGSYTVTLTVTGASGCTSSISKTIEIYPYPDVNFEEPSVNCQGTALNFIADVPSTVTFIEWDFGDPASGEANTSELFDSYHAFDNVGTYTVTLYAQSIYGCTNSFSRTITVEPNTLNGDISLSTPSPLCEGESTTLSPPAGGVSWVWSTGSITETLTVDTAGVYDLTITDAEGCEYSPSPVTIDVIPAPESAIRTVEYNEFFQPIIYYYENYETCFGEDVFLEVTENADYTYTWNNGEDGPTTEYSEARDNLLDPGTHDVTLNIIDNITGCSNEIGPFEITIHPLPTNVEITASTAGIICEDTETVFSVTNPDPALTYVWSNGAVGTTMTTAEANDYFVTAINTYGCETQSNEISIYPGPDISKIPSGCHTRCSPDTLCIPFIPFISSYQWYLDGNPIAAPDGTVPELIATQSGDYWLEMVNTLGCTLQSSTLTLELYDGFGTIGGNVYFDVNENGIIDAADTLVSGIDFNLLENGSIVSGTSSNQQGAYAFSNILSTTYTLEINTATLPTNYSAYQVTWDTTLVGCDDEIEINGLLFEDCPPITNALALSICQGETIDYNGMTLSSDTSFVAQYVTLDGCDSTDNVTLTVLSESSSSLQLEACTNGTVNYEGTNLSPGTTQDFTFTNALGCDSIVTVSVVATTAITSSLQLEACENGTVNYQGVDLSPGDVQDFTLVAASGCDSILTVSVAEIPTTTGSLQLEACASGTVNFQGIDLSPGDTQDFTLVAASGCDSILTVSVAEIPTTTGSLQLEACASGTVNFQGVDLSPGDVQDFTLVAASGCDSILTVSVLAILPTTGSLQLEACASGTVNFQGVDLSPGDVQDFTLVAASGCDSILTVSVAEIPTTTGSLQLEACESGTVNFQGIDLSPGDTQDFTLVAASGCDSILTVSVAEIPTTTGSLQLEACASGSINFQGVDLSPGDVQDFTLVAASGCDSILTVSVAEIPTTTGSLQLEACASGTVNFQGVDLSPGDTQDFTLVAASGCDSILTVSVAEIPTTTGSLQLEACASGTVNFQGVDLSPGDTQDFTLVAASGCDSILTVSVAEIPTTTGSLQLEACASGTVNFQGVDLSPGDTQDFTLVAASGCDSILTVSVAEIPTTTGSLQLEACASGTVNFQGVDLSPGDVQDFTLVAASGCDSILTVSVSSIPIVYNTLQLEACENETIFYEGMELSVGDQVDVTFTSTSNCDSIVSVSVAAYPELFFDFLVEESCPNIATGLITIENISGGVPPYRYSIDGVNFVSDPEFSTAAGLVDLYVQDAEGCIAQDMTIVPALPSLQVVSKEAFLPCDLLRTTIDVDVLSGENISYEWEDGSTDSYLEVTGPGIYEVQVSTTCETITEQITVDFEALNLVDYLYVPNAFSPNDDGINDEFMAYRADGVGLEQYTLDVFDRWGNHIFHSEDIEQGWRGAFRTSKLEVGVYIWQIQASVNTCGQVFEVERSGDVVLLR